MSLWFCESQTPAVRLCTRVKETLHSDKTGPQELAVLSTYQFGPALIVDGAMQTTSRDEFIYHEMLTHVPLYTHSHPEDILLIGGGDGGSLREILKHPQVKSIRLVEADRRVVELSKKHLPQLSACLEDPRVEILYAHGCQYLRETKDRYDVILVDTPVPVGRVAEHLTKEFYQDIYTALREDGIFAIQSASPFFQEDVMLKIHRNIQAIFPITRMYLAFIPTQPGGIWSFTLGSKDYDPLSTLAQKTPIPTRYYTCRLHRSAFVLPRFLEEMLDQEGPTGKS
ncbi:MAG: polyamine aminopropyltransferase [Firmicutes bacterium]|nr:polyamine aminopropyltransferase [Bacillota bacterium]